jgi:hypothetical protein
MITETPEVEEALAPLRERGVKIDLKRLLVLGAHAQMNDIERKAQERAEEKARQQEALDSIRELVDIDVLLSDEAWR